jgi:hypothetical protein
LKRLVGLLVWLLSTTGEGVLHWGVEAWLDGRLAQQMAAQPGPVVAAAVAWRPPPPAPHDPPPPPAPPPPDPSWRPGTAGEHFTLFVLSQEKRWKLRTAEVVDASGDKVEDMEDKLAVLLWQQGMQYGDLVAIGTASCEGAPAQERERAARRSHRLVDWLRGALATTGDTEPRKIYRLTLGQYRDCHGLSPEETDEQRRVIVLAIRPKNHGMGLEELKERLHRDLSQYRPLGFDPAEYSEFSLYEAR